MFGPQILVLKQERAEERRAGFATTDQEDRAIQSKVEPFEWALENSAQRFSDAHGLPGVLRRGKV